MTKTPQKVTDTDIFGRPRGIKRIYAIDSSIFPSIPASTIGVVAMANAYRIAKLSKL